MKLTAGVGVCLLGAMSVAMAAQGQEPAAKAEIASLEFQTPKNGMVQQYEGWTEAESGVAQAAEGYAGIVRV